MSEFTGRGAFAAFSTRIGGVSTGPYESLNVGLKVGDDVAAVRRNRQVLWNTAGLDESRSVRPQQVHSDVVCVATSRDAGCTITGADALVTAEPGLPLVAHFADCTPVFFLDPVTRTGGIAHSGWRGTVKGISARVVEKMAAAFGAAPSDIIAVIGPAIGPCCYEVGEDVFEAAARAFPWAEAVFTVREGGAVRRWMFNMWEANRRLLVDAGVRPENVHSWNMCTCCRKDLFFSYRRDGPKSGRMAGVFTLIG